MFTSFSKNDVVTFLLIGGAGSYPTTKLIAVFDQTFRNSLLVCINRSKTSKIERIFEKQDVPIHISTESEHFGCLCSSVVRALVS